MAGASSFLSPFVLLATLLLSFTTTNTIRTTTTSTPSKPKRLHFNLVHSKAIIPTNDLVLDDYMNDPLINLLPMTDVSALLVNFSIGQPPVQQFSVMDTASRRRWLMCKSQNTGPKNVFYPSNSSTYKALACQDALCGSASYCPFPNFPCLFSNTYAQGRDNKTDVIYVNGFLAIEQFTFGTYEGAVIQLPTVVFGCANSRTNENGTFGTDPRFNGVFGLGDIPFLANVGGGNPRFSYCIGDIRNPSYSYSQLQLGEDVELDGKITSLGVDEDGPFTLAVKSIFFGNEKLNIDAHRFIIDTGAEFTYFPRKWYYEIEKKIQDALMRLGFKDDDRILGQRADNCYMGSVVDDLKRFPSFKLQFEDTVEMVFNPINLFYQRSKKSKSFCFAIKPRSDDFVISVLGLPSQQGFNFGFDVAAKKFYFFNVDCEDLL